MSELISIIVPVFNTKDYLDECVESILMQSYENIEIILVDDGSTDGSSKMCDDWAKRDSRVVVLHQNNKGVSAARNLALENARGLWIAFVDADDFIDDNYIKCLYEAAKEYDAQIVGCQIQTIIRRSEYEKESDLDISKNVTVKTREEAINYAATGGKYMAHLFLASLINKKKKPVRFHIDLYYGEDLLFLYQALSGAKKYARLSQCLYGYRENNDGAVSIVWNPKWDSVLTAFDRLMKMTRKYDNGRFLPHIEYQQAGISLFLRRYTSGNPMDKKMKKRVQSIVRDRWYYLLNSKEVPFVIKSAAVPMLIHPALAEQIYRLYLSLTGRKGS